MASRRGPVAGAAEVVAVAGHAGRDGHGAGRDGLQAPAALLDAGAAGELLGVPKSWVLAEARADRIPHVRFGRYVRFDAGALEAWWRGRMRGPVAGWHPAPRARDAA